MRTPESAEKPAHPNLEGQCQPIPDGWYNYAALAAAGMCTTPTDMAKFAIDLSESFRGEGTGLLSRELAGAMVTRQANTPFGMGGIVTGQGDHLNFSKTGHTLG